MAVAERKVQVSLPRLHTAQQQIMAEARRFNVLNCGRRFGKSLMGFDLAARVALAGKPVGWFAPNYDLLEPSWRAAKQALEAVTTDKSEREHRLAFLTGGSLEFWSMDTGKAGRSRRYQRVIVDEAAQDENLADAWQLAIRPTLTDFRGDAWFLSTPRGLNYFHTLFQAGQDPGSPEWMSWQMPTSANPYIHPEEIEAAREDLPARAFAQEYLAEFLSDGAGVFRKVLEACTLQPQARQEGHAYVLGADWGKLNDYTVLSVLDATTKRQVALDRFNKIDYAFQMERVETVLQQYRPRQIVAERNSMGEPLIEHMQRKGWPVTPWVATNATKSSVIEALSLALERRQLTLLVDRTQTAELLAYDAVRLPSGLFRYGAPQGMHDDCFVKGTQVLTRAGQRPIEDITVGDMVMTRDGYRRVVMTRSTEKTVVTNHLLGLTGTPDHPVITPSGEVGLANVRESDTIYVWNERRSRIETRTIIATLSHLADTSASTSGDTPRTKPRHSRFIVKSGSTLMDRSRRAVTFITRMVTRSTTPSVILSSWIPESTSGNTCSNLPGVLNPWQAGNDRRSGSCATSAHGAPNSQMWPPQSIEKTDAGTQAVSRQPLPRGAETIQTWRTSKPSETETPRLHAVSMHFEYGAGITRNWPLPTLGRTLRRRSSVLRSREPADTVGLRSPSRGDVVRSTAPRAVESDTATRQRVYNLQVDGTPEYFANGILVHNCVMALALAWQGCRAEPLPASLPYRIGERAGPGTVKLHGVAAVLAELKARRQKR